MLQKISVPCLLMFLVGTTAGWAQNMGIISPGITPGRGEMDVVYLLSEPRTGAPVVARLAAGTPVQYGAPDSGASFLQVTVPMSSGAVISGFVLPEAVKSTGTTGGTATPHAASQAPPWATAPTGSGPAFPPFAPTAPGMPSAWLGAAPGPGSHLVLQDRPRSRDARTQNSLRDAERLVDKLDHMVKDFRNQQTSLDELTKHLVLLKSDVQTMGAGMVGPLQVSSLQDQTLGLIAGTIEAHLAPPASATDGITTSTIPVLRLGQALTRVKQSISKIDRMDDLSMTVRSLGGDVEALKKTIVTALDSQETGASSANAAQESVRSTLESVSQRMTGLAREFEQESSRARMDRDLVETLDSRLESLMTQLKAMRRAEAEMAMGTESDLKGVEERLKEIEGRIVADERQAAASKAGEVKSLKERIASLEASFHSWVVPRPESSVKAIPTKGRVASATSSRRIMGSPVSEPELGEESQRETSSYGETSADDDAAGVSHGTPQSSSTTRKKSSVPPTRNEIPGAPSRPLTRPGSPRDATPSRPTRTPSYSVRPSSVKPLAPVPPSPPRRDPVVTSGHQQTMARRGALVAAPAWAGAVGAKADEAPDSSMEDPDPNSATDKVDAGARQLKGRERVVFQNVNPVTPRERLQQLKLQSIQALKSFEQRRESGVGLDREVTSQRGQQLAKGGPARPAPAPVSASSTHGQQLAKGGPARPAPAPVSAASPHGQQLAKGGPARPAPAPVSASSPHGQIPAKSGPAPAPVPRTVEDHLRTASANLSVSERTRMMKDRLGAPSSMPGPPGSSAGTRYPQASSIQGATHAAVALSGNEKRTQDRMAASRLGQILARYRGQKRIRKEAGTERPTDEVAAGPVTVPARPGSIAEQFTAMKETRSRLVARTSTNVPGGGESVAEGLVRSRVAILTAASPVASDSKSKISSKAAGQKASGTPGGSEDWLFGS